MGELVAIKPAQRYPQVGAQIAEILAPERVELAYAYANRRAMNMLVDCGLLRWRFPRYAYNGSIDVEIDHPLHGWIPFTASPTDIEDYGRRIFWALHNEGVAKPFVGDVPAEIPFPFPDGDRLLPRRRWWQFWRKA